MKSDYLKMVLEGKDRSAILDNMAQTSFDEHIEFDLKHGSCRVLYHLEKKYYPISVHSSSCEQLYLAIGEQLVHEDDRGEYLSLLDPATLLYRLEKAPIRGVLDAELRCRTRENGWRWTRCILIGGTDYGLPEGVVWFYLYDIQDEKDQEESKTVLPQADLTDASRDELTGLYRERVFLNLAQERIQALEGDWCVIAVDIEHFKLFRDWNGQENGTLLLAEIGRILQAEAARVNGLAGYRGQDDFCLLCPFHKPSIRALYEEIRQAINQYSKTVGFSPIFGICRVEQPGDQVLTLMNRAALTAEEAKGDFRNRIQLFSPEKHEKNTREFRLLAWFQHAIENGEICFFLQPQCRVSNRKVVGAEALARWKTADGVQISPAEFVPILEKYGVITHLDEYIWDQVCCWLRSMLDRGLEPVPVSINVSQLDIFTINVPEYLSALAQKYDLPHKYLKVEVTESAYVEDTSMVRQTVKTLRDMGFLVLMDDFGSGYSSLNMLSSLNVDVIKLDAQFLHISLNEERKGVSILESIINMAKTLGTPIVAEGVESREQMRFLSDLGCRYMQGYYFYRPMPKEEFESLLRNDDNIDYKGFLFKANQQMHIREFLDENIFSDAMLNNVLGPVCFYNWQGEDVDILRFNQQFYLMIGLDVDVLEARRYHIQQFFHPDDLPAFYAMLAAAEKDHINGAKGTFRVFKPNGTIFWIALRVYYLSKDVKGKKFYASAQDVTELQLVSTDLPGGYYRCSLEGDYEFLYISQNFLTMTGFTEEEIAAQFNNRMLNMIHPGDRSRVKRDAEDILAHRRDDMSPYRLRHKTKDYIYVVEKNRLTDRFGPLCWQCIFIEVTEIVRLRNQMQVLCESSSDSVVFVHPDPKHTVRYEVVVHGLRDVMGWDAAEFQKRLNDGSFLQCFDLPEERKDRTRYYLFQGRLREMNDTCTVRLPGREPIRLQCRFDQVKDDTLNALCIIVFSLAK